MHLKPYQTFAIVPFSEKYVGEKALSYMFQRVQNTPLHTRMHHSQKTFTYLKSIIETPEKRREICSKLTIKTPEQRN